MKLGTGGSRSLPVVPVSDVLLCETPAQQMYPASEDCASLKLVDDLQQHF